MDNFLSQEQKEAWILFYLTGSNLSAYNFARVSNMIREQEISQDL